MAGLTSIGGLVSGLDTASIVSQLIAIEGNKQTLLKTQLAAVNSTKSSLQTINVQMTALMTTAKALAGTSGWTARLATSSSANVSASATTSAALGAYSFTVNHTATAHKLVFTNTPTATDQPLAAGTLLKFTASDGTVTEFSAGDGTMGGLVNAINGADVGVTASVVTLDGGGQRLSVTSKTTGADSSFTLTQKQGNKPLLGGPDATRGTTGANASITINGDTITSSTNTFKDVFTGITFTLSTKATAGEKVTLDVATDSSAVSASAKKLVEQVNAILTEIATKTAFNADAKTKSPLSGNTEVRQIREQLLSAVSGSVNGVSLETVGIELTKDGKLSFDAAKFDKAFAADPASVQKMFSETTVVGSTTTPIGLAAKLDLIADRASNVGNGTLVASMNGSDSRVKTLTESIEAWDRRLAMRKTTLERQYASMESALSTLQSQASWLAGQIATLTPSS